METQDPHPHLALLLKQYARDLAQSAPSPELDARIDRLVADPARIFSPAPLRRRSMPPYAAAAGFAADTGLFCGSLRSCCRSSRVSSRYAEISERSSRITEFNCVTWRESS